MLSKKNRTPEWWNKPCTFVFSRSPPFRYPDFDTCLLVKPKIKCFPFQIRVFELEAILHQELWEQFVHLG